MTRIRKNFPLIIIFAVLLFLVVCPLLMIFAKAVIRDDRLDIMSALETLAESENAQMIFNSLLLGLLVVIVSTIIAAPLAYLFSRTRFARYRFFDIVFMIPFIGGFINKYHVEILNNMIAIYFIQKRKSAEQFTLSTLCRNKY